MDETRKDLVQASIAPRSSKDRQRLRLALSAFAENDPSITWPSITWIEAETGNALLRAANEADLAIALDEIKRAYAIDADISPPKVVYRATIARVTEIDYTHKRQIGGTGEFARIKLTATANDIGRGFKFRSEIVGGAVPEAYIPAVEKGLRSVIGPGMIAGDPVVDISVILFDGAFHDIDSSPLIFETAARMAMRQVLDMGELVILEPVMRLDVVTPADYAELIAADLRARRGRIERLNLDEDSAIIHALAPLANLLDYGNQLNARSDGRASYSRRFDHYDRVPPEHPEPPFRPAAAMRLQRCKRRGPPHPH
jgi:elongation factor G